MSRLTLIFIAVILIGCGAKKEVAQTETAPPPPSWVSSRPISSSYYVGIGLSQKAPGINHQRVAKENALSDLASEIEVNVKSNSLLYTLEREYKFEQEFRETIKTQTNLELEDFEVVDSWEDQNAYWVYYRLDKATYRAKQEKKKQTAQQLGLDFLSKAESAKNSGQYAASADHYLRGIQALEEFANEENKVNYGGTEIFLANELFIGLNQLLSSPQIKLEDQIILNFQNRFKTDASLLVTSNDGSQPFEGVPIVYEYFGVYGRNKSKLSTNADGRLNVQISEVDKERSQNTVDIRIDSESIFELYQSDKFMKELTKSIRPKSIQEPIQYLPPTVYISSTEKNLGKSLENNPIKSAVMNSLQRREISFANSPKNADLSIQIAANTKKSGEAQGFSTCTLEVDLSLVDNASGEKRYQVTNSNVKGVDLDYNKAGLKAYKNLTRNIESELMRKLVNDIF